MNIFRGLAILSGRKLLKISRSWMSGVLRFMKWYITPDATETDRWRNAASRAAMIARALRINL